MTDSTGTSPTLISRIAGAACLLAAVEGLAAARSILLIPGESENAVLLGLSGQRLILIAILALAVLAGLGLGLYCLLRAGRAGAAIGQWTEKGKGSKAAFYLLIFSAAAAWCALLTPSYQFGRYQAYFERLQPIVIWLALALLQALLVWFLARRKAGTGRAAVPGGIFKRGSAFWPALAVFLACLAVWGLMAWSGLGFRPDNVHWNDAGAPILPGQIAASFLVGLLVFFLERWMHLRGPSKKFQAAFDVAVFVLIWAAAAVIWIGQPLPHSFFAPGPYPPNNEPYPFSDAAGYDVSAQYALLGQGLMNKEYVDKPLYSAFLVFLHLLSGQKYFPVVNLQAAVIALFPALLYLFGRKLNSRAGGAAAAMLVVFREVNTIGITLWVLSASTKVLMSEPLTMLGLGFFGFFLILWLRSPARGPHWLALAGGSLGATTLVRHNPWLLIPVAGILILAGLGWNWRKILLGLGVFVVAFAAAISPWMLRNQLNNGRPLYFLVPFEGVVLKQRYETGFRILHDETPTPGPASSTQAPGLTPTPEPVSTPAPSSAGGILSKLIGKGLEFIPDHAFHNLLVTSAIFPTSFMFDDLAHTIKAPGSIWDAAWTGRLSLEKALILLIFLALVSVGFGVSWKRARWAGAVPAVIYLGYNLATAVARTSGARYIQPVDWVALFYLAIGLIQAWKWLNTALVPASASIPSGFDEDRSGAVLAGFTSWKVLGALVLGMTVGGLPFLSELVFPRHFPISAQAGLAEKLASEGWADRAGITTQDLGNFLRNDQAVLLQARALYPRYYGIGQGEPDRFSAYREQNYPRLVITSIGPKGMQYGALPLQHAPESFPNGSDVLLIGCTAEGKPELDLAAIVVTGPEPAVFARDPAAPLTCPLPQPVCDDNRVCR